MAEATDSDAVLVLNAGSSSIKLSLFRVGAGNLALAWHGELEGIGTAPHFHAKGPNGAQIADEQLKKGLSDPIGWVLDWIDDHLGSAKLIACGHRVVHGGADHRAPERIDDRLLALLEELVPLAPLHQPVNLTPIRAIRTARPALPQVACYDTAFHRGHAEHVACFALPYRYYEQGVRRYGFHGLSCEYIASRLPDVSPKLAEGKVVVAHLGSGASMCALDQCRSVDTTMGLSALDGLPMGTRTGQIDPGVLLYLMQHEGMNVDQVVNLLYRESGLKGLSGVSNDMRTLQTSGEERAKLAIEVFVHQIAKQTMGLAGSMGGLDGIVFTAGIGEHSPAVRAAVLRKLAWFGFALDDGANEAGGPLITTAESAKAAYVIPTDEELMIARHTVEVVGVA
jgi:acetate kinase